MNDPKYVRSWEQSTLDAATMPVAAEEIPERIGRYRIERLLGRGSYGLVYLAHDEQLLRLVAVKVPHGDLLARARDTDAYLTEARTVAALDHPNIVPVYDAGRAADCPCFIVSKFIEGRTLAQRIKEARVTLSEAADLVATIAEALDYAHRKGLVHRDVKPGNILLDLQGRPYIADFGLALKEENIGAGMKCVGTPAYMSPEQAQGEGHRVDGRSDIFSLGVVLYELLTGIRPFAGRSTEEVQRAIASSEPRSPRHADDRIPRELERICLKALARRAADRYSSAEDMAGDLRLFLADDTVARQASGVAASSHTWPEPPATAALAGSTGRSATQSGSPASHNRPIKIVPKGLRSFDAHDADFFLELLPGPRDRNGLPDSLRFWKLRIEESEADNTVAVGLIYGPSGCGKSSLVKAGLLPRLSADVIAVYVEATADETEGRLLNGLRKRFPTLPIHLNLKESIALLRRGEDEGERTADGDSPVHAYQPSSLTTRQTKVVIILDQFEQWLHARKEVAGAELVQALRQCDGEHVQCIVMVRDDFWMATTRFLRELEIRLLEGHNSAAVDLFDPDHARKVLAAFGRAFGKLPEVGLRKEHRDFLNQAVAGLTQDGKVICVRLALFAEMMKGKPWTPATLREVGGTQGVGATFLEETFSAAGAPPEHRYHQGAARAVLKALLPETGADIKGNMRSRQELLEASGYAGHPRDFDELMRILDSEVRLITPTDPEGPEAAAPPEGKAGEQYYQLSHDYLVHSLRDWLTRKQKETRRGRAELLLADRAAVWNARRENRQLPSLWQWSSIRWLTQPRNWTPPQRRMMRRATRYHAVRAMAAAAVLALLAWAGHEGRGALKAHALVERLLDAKTSEVLPIVRDMTPYRRWVDPLLREADAEAKTGSNRRKLLHTSLALLPVDASVLDYLYGRLLVAEPGELAVIREALVPHQKDILARLWTVVEAPEKGKESQRLRAAAALALFDPENEKWAAAQEAVAGELVAVPAVYLSVWMDALRPVRAKLLPQLSAIYGDSTHRDAERSLATNILADYAADSPAVLADLLMDADEKQFALIFPRFASEPAPGLSALIGEIDRPSPPEAPGGGAERSVQRQANAAVALLRLNEPARVWPLFRHSADPRVRTYLIHRLYPFGVEAGAVVKRLEAEPDVTVRRALLLCLGEYGEEGLSPEARRALLPALQQTYQREPDPGLHAAAEWLLRQWKQQDWLRQTSDQWALDAECRSKPIRAALASGALPQWYVNTQAQTMVVIPGPVEFHMGSPPTEADREPNELPHRRRIGRTFAVAAKPATIEEFRRFDASLAVPEKIAPSPGCPAVTVSWYQAAAYCNWLSKQEGIPEAQWCYAITGNEVLLKPNYLRLSGYRLPTEAEMEYATRAGARTSRCFGEAADLLPKYAWFGKNSQYHIWPVGLLKPNDLGLFDVHGNIWTWCQESHRLYPNLPDGELCDDQEDDIAVLNKSGASNRALRGGGCFNRPPILRSAFRNSDMPALRNITYGFRVARTIMP